MENELFLVYVNPIGQDSKGLYQYEFFFSETPEIVWGNDWNVACPSACGAILPEESTYSTIKLLKTKMNLFCAQQNSCFSMQDVIDGLMCLVFVNEGEEFFKFDFAENYEDVIKKINFE